MSSKLRPSRTKYRQAFFDKLKSNPLYVSKQKSKKLGLVCLDSFDFFRSIPEDERLKIGIELSKMSRDENIIFSFHKWNESQKFFCKHYPKDWIESKIK